MTEENSLIDSTDDEGDIDETPFQVSWLDMSFAGCYEKLGISCLPGNLHEMGVQDVFCLCTKGELNKYRVPHLLHEFGGVDILVHHYPFPDGLTPSVPKLVKMLEEMRLNLLNGRTTLVQCYGGVGRSCLVAACLMMMMDTSMAADDAIKAVRELRGPAAIQSVKQFNFMHDFRELLAEHTRDEEVNRRSLSR